MQTEKFIILKRMKFGESDLIVYALSKQGAKQKFIAHGALKSQKRFGGGVLEPSHFVEFTYQQTSRDHGLFPLLEAKLINDFSGIRKSYDHLQVALHFLEAVYRVSQEGDQKSSDLFNLLGHALAELQRASDLVAFKLHFNLKFLMQQGVLNPVEWMRDYLRSSLKEMTNFGSLEEKGEWAQIVDRLIKSYLQSAQLHH